MGQYRVTPKAKNDLVNIARYTEEQWGKDQRNRYLTSLEKRFRWLADNPDRGKHRKEICEGYFSYPQGQHVVFYLREDEAIFIIGLPHTQMDIFNYF